MPQVSQTTVLKNPVNIVECAMNEFRCNDSLCVHEDKWCDGIMDCLDDSDEPLLCFLGKKIFSSKLLYFRL